MLGKFLLIDQRLNETRVAIVKDSVLEDFDDELSTKKLKKGNIYIGRIMRIEPSLQAAFVDFGFEKHGFLAFSEIVGPEIRPTKPAESETIESPIILPPPITPPIVITDPITEIVTNEDEERPQRPTSAHGKVHDFIKRQQLIMVQVIKDERGSKGAALTTYISLPGRYGFFLPNTPKASGISKKITDTSERDALKVILGALDVPDGMSFILRSAAIGRKKSEIKRDYDFLTKTWETIAAHPTNAISLVYAEQDLLIRALRDLYSNDVQEVIIQGEDAFKRARSYIRAVFPSYSKKITPHTEPCTLFEKFKIESQIEAIYNHTVLLPSGGSIILNQTEALVSIDVNSSKSTQERNIEDTALKTNLEACVAIARNLKLRDLAGLIVIDFIDLHPNKRPVVEKALKDALAMDRARLKVGKISEFGLLEMSRQRLRQSLMESNTHLCTTCHGAGRLLSLPMQSMRALRAIERIAATNSDAPTIEASGSADLVLCLLNTHRQFLCDIEKKYGKNIAISVDPSLDSGALNITKPLVSTEVKSEESPAAPKKRRRNRSKSGKNGDAVLQNPVDLSHQNSAQGTPTDDVPARELETQPSAAHTPTPLIQDMPHITELPPVKESRWARLRKRRQAKIQANSSLEVPFLLVNPIGIDDLPAPLPLAKESVPASTETKMLPKKPLPQKQAKPAPTNQKPIKKPAKYIKEKAADEPLNTLPENIEQKLPQKELSVQKEGGKKPENSSKPTHHHRKKKGGKKPDHPTPLASAPVISVESLKKTPQEPEPVSDSTHQKKPSQARSSQRPSGKARHVGSKVSGGIVLLPTRSR